MTAVPSYLLSKQIGENLESLLVMGWSLIVGGIVMWVVDAMFRRPRVERLEDMNVPQAVWIGAVQILSAVFPGTSRSMSHDRGWPGGGSLAPGGAGVFVLPLDADDGRGDGLRSAQGDQRRGDAADAAPPVTLTRIAGSCSLLASSSPSSSRSAVVAWFMNWVRARGFVPFAIYRIVARPILLAG